MVSETVEWVQPRVSTLDDQADYVLRFTQSKRSKWHRGQKRSFSISLSVCLSLCLCLSVSLCLCPSLSLCQFYPLLSLRSRDFFYKSIILFRFLVQRISWLTHIDINNRNKTTLIHAAPSFGYLYVILHTHGLNPVDGNVYWLIKKKNETIDLYWTAKTFWDLFPLI